MEKMVATLEEFEAEAVRFARELAPAEQGATLVTLSGELGAGKTAFTKSLARAYGVTEIVTSPTFVLEKIYQLPHETGGHLVSTRFVRLVHIDAYRLESGKNLAPLGFDEVMKDASNLVVLEWPERVADVLPAPAVRLTIVAYPDGSRSLTYG